MIQEFDNINDFIIKYGKLYGKQEIKRLLDEDESAELYDSDGIGGLSESLEQIYHSIGRLPSSYDPYLIILKVLLEKFDIGCNILEVASGKYPALGYDVAKKQLDLGIGTITFMDPNLICNESNKLYKNVTPLREQFTANTDISQYDIVLANRPHNVLIDLIKSVINNDKDFLIFPCSCYDNNIIELINNRNLNGNIVPTYEYAKQLCIEQNKSQPILEQVKIDYVRGYSNKYNYFYKKNK